MSEGFSDKLPVEAGGQLPRAVLYAVFALSGLLGLIYEATWTRYLQLFLGHAAYAQVLVLALFMAGMGGGALLAGRLSRALASPLLTYACIEAGLGVAALVFHPLFNGATAMVYSHALPPFLQDALPAAALHWLLAAALILPQSILLGMTFPLMSIAVLRLGVQKGGRVFAMLYFTNSAGAVFGVLMAGFWLFEAVGLQATMTIAGIGNLLVAGVALLVVRHRTAPTVTPPRGPSNHQAARWLLAFAFLTALSSFIYEVAWLRMLALVQGASTHAFETMLSAFILGIALGGWWIRGRIERLRSPLQTLAAMQVLMGVAALATLPAYHQMFDVMQFAMQRLPRTGDGYFGYVAVGYLISAVIMVPASFFAGTTLPLLTYFLYVRGRGETDIGAIYGWNTLGGIAGVALAGLLLMPLIGLKNMIVAGAAIDIALGAALATWLLTRGELHHPRVAGALGAIALVGLTSAVFVFELDAGRLSSGVFRYGRLPAPGTSKVLVYADGRTASVSVVDHGAGRRVIATNGKIDASINMGEAPGSPAYTPVDDEYTMTLLGALPLVHAPGARKAAIIGHGSGLTTHVVLASPVIERVDVVEIEPEMVRLAKAFLPRVARAYDDPRARLHITDARTWFAAAAPEYDFIISEPSNPWVSGVASLFTPEFYRQARRALVPGGLFVQWFHLYEIDRPSVTAIIGALAAVFPDYLIYATGGNDVVVVAANADVVPPATGKLFAWPLMREDLSRLKLMSPAQLALFRVANRRAYGPLLEHGLLNSDYFPTLEFRAARARFLDAEDAIVADLARDPVPVLEILSGFKPPVSTASLPATPLGPARMRDIERGNRLAAALNAAAEPTSGFSESELNLLRTVRGLREIGDAATWDGWFNALLGLSKSMIPNGNASELARFLRSAEVAESLKHAPPEVRDKVEFLLLVAARDLAGMRREGARILSGPIQSRDPAFHAYTLVATVTACFAMSSPDESCRQQIALLDLVQRRNPVFDLLRAHQRAMK